MVMVSCALGHQLKLLPCSEVAAIIKVTFIMTLSDSVCYLAGLQTQLYLKQPYSTKILGVIN